jgi:hypothetical protein
MLLSLRMYRCLYTLELHRWPLTRKHFDNIHLPKTKIAYHYRHSFEFRFSAGYIVPTVHDDKSMANCRSNYSGGQWMWHNGLSIWYFIISFCQLLNCIRITTWLQLTWIVPASWLEEMVLCLITGTMKDKSAKYGQRNDLCIRLIPGHGKKMVP